jgi:hypothetical protein
MLNMKPQLESSLSSLRELLAHTSTILETLTHETISEIANDSTNQLNTLKSTISYMENERSIELQHRVGKARQQATELGERMEKVKRKIQDWEEREMEEEKRRKRRVGIVWGTIGILILIMVIVIIVGKMSEGLDMQEETKSNWTKVVIEKERNGTTAHGNTTTIEDLLRDIQDDSLSSGVSQPKPQAPKEENPVDIDDDLLSRMFDEL